MSIGISSPRVDYFVSWMKVFTMMRTRTRMNIGIGLCVCGGSLESQSVSQSVSSVICVSVCEAFL